MNRPCFSWTPRLLLRALLFAEALAMPARAAAVPTQNGLAPNGLAPPAQSPPNEPTPSPASKPETNEVPSILLVFDPAHERAAAAVRAVESHLSGLRVAVELVPLPPSSSLSLWLEQASQEALSRKALGSFVIDATPEGEILIFFSEGDAAASLLRRIRPKAAGGRVALEETGIVVGSLVEALLEGRHIGMEAEAPAQSAPLNALPPEPSPPLEKPAPSLPLRARSQRHTGVSIGYVGTSFAADTFQSGLALGARTDLVERLALLFNYTLFAQLELTRESTRLSLQRHPMVLGLSYEAAGTLAPILEVTAFADLVTRRTSSAMQGLAATPAQGHWIWGVGSRIGAHYAPVSPIHLHVTFGVDVPFGNLSYVVDGDQPRTLLIPRSVRPQLEATIIANVW